MVRAAVGAAVVTVLGLGAVVVGLWPGVVSAGLAGGGQATVFFAGLGLLAWGAAWLAVSGGREPDGNDSNTGSNPGASTGRPPPTLGG